MNATLSARLGRVIPTALCAVLALSCQQESQPQNSDAVLGGDDTSTTSVPAASPSQSNTTTAPVSSPAAQASSPSATHAGTNAVSPNVPRNVAEVPSSTSGPAGVPTGASTSNPASAAGGGGGRGGEAPLDSDAGAAGGGTIGSGGGAGGEPAIDRGEPPTIYIAGDSTVSTYRDTESTTDQAGWGQMLHEYFEPSVVVENRAIGGRTARRFIDEGYLAEIDADIGPGDALLVQFGTNDGHKTATYELDGQQIPYYLDPATDFKDYLSEYIDVAADHDATLVFVTPPPRNSAYCTGGNGTGAHAQAMRELAAERDVALADLNQMTVDHLIAICPAPTPEDFFFVRADGTVDGTHFQENGARIMAGFVADGIEMAGVPLSGWLRPNDEEGR